MESKHLTKITLGLILALTFSCGGEKEEEEKTESKPSEASLPEVISSSLKMMSSSSGLHLKSDDGECDSEGSLGAFELPIGAACIATELAEFILYGSKPDRNNDGRLTCADYKHSGDDDQGILMALLCEDVMKQNDKVKTLKFSDDSDTYGISFEDFETPSGRVALGHWTASKGDSHRYPGKIRVWKTVNDDLKGLVAIDMKSALEGQIYIDFSSAEANATIEIDIKGVKDVSKCRKDPSSDNCHRVSFKLHGDENATGAEGELFPAIELNVLGEGRYKSNFAIVEGSTRVNEAIASKWFDNSEYQALVDTREIYFRTAIKGSGLWGSLELMDEDGVAIDDELAKYLKNGTSGTAYNGICQKYGVKDPVDCKTVNIDSSVYSDWQGNTEFRNVGPDYELPVEFGEAPSEWGVVTAK